MRLTMAIFVAATILSVRPRAPETRGHMTSACRALDDDAILLIEYVKGFSTLNAPARDSVGLTGVDSSTVALVSDSVTCARVIAAVDSAFHSGPTSTPAIVVRGGGMYVLHWPSSTPSDNAISVLHFVDSTFTYRRGLTGY